MTRLERLVLARKLHAAILATSVRYAAACRDFDESDAMLAAVRTVRRRRAALERLVLALYRLATDAAV